MPGCDRIDSGDSCPNRATKRLGLVWQHSQGTSISWMTVVICDDHPEITADSLVDENSVGLVRATLKRNGIDLIGDTPLRLVREAL